ncbi:hypothetical protein HanHA300_Chr05g0158971 [Helianthus annuus]|nr:hypothetical protein HanHA300_Chr05g0158971 [Helianthus annuus]
MLELEGSTSIQKVGFFYQNKQQFILLTKTLLYKSKFIRHLCYTYQFIFHVNYVCFERVYFENEFFFFFFFLKMSY